MGKDEDEYMECHWLFTKPRPKPVVEMENKLDKIENYLYRNKDNISNKVYNDLLDILWNRKK